MFPYRYRSVALALLCLVLAACGQPTATPKPVPGQIAPATINKNITDMVTADDTVAAMITNNDLTDAKDAASRIDLTYWTPIKKGVQPLSAESYAAIESGLAGVNTALVAPAAPDPAQAKAALATLKKALTTFQAMLPKSS